MFLRKFILVLVCLLVTSCFIQSDDAGMLRHIVPEPTLSGEWTVYQWGDKDVSTMKDRTLRVVESQRDGNPVYQVLSENVTFTASVKGVITFYRFRNTGFMYTGYPSNCDGCYLMKYERSGDAIRLYTLNTIQAEAYLEKSQIPKTRVSYKQATDNPTVNVKSFNAENIKLLEEMARKPDLWSLHAVLKRN